MKRISALFWDAPILAHSKTGYRASDVQKQHFMVNEHDNPSGYLTSKSWQTVSEVFIAEKDLQFMGIGVFDVNIDWNNYNNSLLPDSLVTPDSNASTAHQDIYYYLDDVKVINMGPANTCDCDDLDQDIRLFATHTQLPDQCCTIVHLKVDGQQNECRINGFRWRSTHSGSWNEVSFIDRLGIKQVEDGIFVPIDTICVDEKYDGTPVKYYFEFKTLRGSFGCEKELDVTVDCAACPCDWALDSIPDSGDSTKNAIRLETSFVSRDSANNCCFDIVFINNTPMPISGDKFKLSKFNGDIESFSGSSDDKIEFINNPTKYEWLLTNGQIAPYDTLNLGTICITDSSSIMLYWDLLLASTIDGKYVSCFGNAIPPPVNLSCSECCPDAKLTFEKVNNVDDCCILVKSFDNGGCGERNWFYNVEGTTETGISLPYEFCADNSDFKLRIKVLDENDTVICTKNYDFSDLVFECSCCDNLVIDVKEDKSYTGTGCKYVIDRFLNDSNCDFGSSTTIEWGYVDSLGYHYEGVKDYDEYESWVYYLSGCESKTIRFNLKDDGNVICSKDVTIKCQECSDLDFSFVNADFDSVLYQGQYRPKDCCINVIFGDAPSGNCNYYLKAFYFQENLQMQVDTNDPALQNISSSYDTLQLCAPYPNPQGPNHQQGAFSIQASIGIYDSDGNLICSFNPERICHDSTDYTSLPTKVNIDLDKKLVTDGILSLD
ncbi:MAG: hypothetical protein RIF34_02740, partial [Candidatus Kapaibacterium sp.]